MWEEQEDNRREAEPRDCFTLLGTGRPGGKASGLMHIRNFLTDSSLSAEFPGIEVSIPDMMVICSDVFDAFMTVNDLRGFVETCPSDQVMAETFLNGTLPPQYLGELYAYVDRMRNPLAVRSSSLFEDAKFEPFAGIYLTKMIPNNQFDTATRFNKVVEAIKLVYASTFFEEARSYCGANDLDYREEKMGVILQEVVGVRRGGYFYPDVSGVLRSVNYYPSGYSKPEDGVAQLAVGLGKTIVDGGAAWSISPRHPHKPPPFNSPRDMLKQSQTKIWAVDLKPLAVWNPTGETEFLSRLGLKEAEEAGGLNRLVSSYDASSDRFYPGLFGTGPRLVNFSPLLSDPGTGLPEFMVRLLALAEKILDEAVEIEFALTLDPKRERPVRFGFLQVRPLAVFTRRIEIDIDQFSAAQTLVLADSALGNGSFETIRDIVFVKRETFNPSKTAEMVQEVAEMNFRLLRRRTPYLLIGFGRWGSSEPWMGIPVSWAHIAGAGAIIECALPVMNPDLSQGSHFFHNLSSRGIPYLCLEAGRRDHIDWRKIESFEVVSESRFVRHVDCGRNLTIIVDGKSRRGGVFL